MNKLKLIKGAVGLITSLAVGAVVGNAVKMTTPPNINAISKVLTKVGGFMLGGALGAMASNYAEEQIDSAVENVREVVTELTPQEEDQ